MGFEVGWGLALDGQWLLAMSTRREWLTGSSGQVLRNPRLTNAWLVCSSTRPSYR